MHLVYIYTHTSTQTYIRTLTNTHKFVWLLTYPWTMTYTTRDPRSCTLTNTQILNPFCLWLCNSSYTASLLPLSFWGKKEIDDTSPKPFKPTKPTKTKPSKPTTTKPSQPADEDKLWECGVCGSPIDVTLHVENNLTEPFFNDSIYLEGVNQRELFHLLVQAANQNVTKFRCVFRQVSVCTCKLSKVQWPVCVCYAISVCNDNWFSSICLTSGWLTLCSLQ